MRTKLNLNAQFIYLFYLTHFFQSTFYGIIGYVFVIISLLLLIFSLKFSSAYLTKSDFEIIFSFFLIQFFGFIIAPLLLFIYKNEYLDFFSSVGGRVFNLSLNSVYIIILMMAINKNLLLLEKIEKYFLAGCFFLILFGYWQLFHNLFNIPFPDIGTRAQIHSMKLQIPFLKVRVTSLAEEPSYFIRYLIEPFIVIFLSSNKNIKCRKIKLLLIVVILFFTLSLSGYMNFALIVVYIMLIQKNVVKKIVAAVSGIVIVFIMFIYGGGEIVSVLEAVFSRLNPDVIFKSARLQELYLPLKYQWDSGNFLGFGLKGYVFAANQVKFLFGYNAGKLVSEGSVTSHFLFVDIFIEYGIVGLLGITFFFVYLYKKTWKIYKVYGFAVPNVLVVNYFISNMFVVDYASLHSIVIISLLLFYCKKYPVKQEATLRVKF